MMRALTVFTSLTIFLYASVVTSGWHQPIPRDEITRVIQKLNSTLSQEDVIRLAAAVRQVRDSSDCPIPWKILVSVAFKESALVRHAINHRTHDFGLMQINEKSILRYGLSREMLMSDETYALKAGCRILAENAARYGLSFKHWIGIYQSGTALWEDSVRDTAIRYDRHVRLIAQRIGYRAHGEVAQ